MTGVTIAQIGDDTAIVVASSGDNVTIVQGVEAAGPPGPAGTSGVTDHGALTGLSDDDHPQYILKSLVDGKGDLIVGTADNTVARVAVGSNGKVSKADSTQSAGIAWDYAVPAAGAPKQSSTTYYVQPGVFASSTTAFGMTALLRYFDFLVVQTPITVDQIAIEQTAAAAAGKLFRMFLIAADKWWQPTGSVLIDSGTFAADGANGVKTYTPGSPVLLPAGRYLASVHSDGDPSIRASVGGAIGQGFATTLGSSSSIYQTRTTYIALNASDTTVWDNLSFTTAPSSHFMWLRVSDPTS